MGGEELIMREILFRGKRYDTGEWVYGFYTEACANRSAEPVIENNDNDYYVLPESVGQYTGKKDKNGKRIFEGDIIIGENYLFPVPDNRRLRIYWDNKICGFQMNSFNIDDIEVIGNIHDNPELLN